MTEGWPANEDTGVIAPDDTAAHEVVRVDPPATPGREPPPAPGPLPGPPRGWLAAENPWPWLALVVVAVAALLVWLLLVRGHHSSPIVPRVVGLGQRAAVARLTRDGYDVTVVRRAGSAPAGRVFAQRPGAGARLGHRQAVTIDVANGTRTRAAPAATATATQPKRALAARFAVPDAGGADQPAAGGDVQAAGLVPDSYPVSSSAPAGTVVAQDPSPGTKLPAGASVRLDVSVGAGNRASVAVPDVTGSSAAAARARLWAAKLTVRTVYARASTPSKAGFVLSESALGGRLPAFSQVTLTIGR
jgi:beta-lactam-binding protein with PASTA domain